MLLCLHDKLVLPLVFTGYFLSVIFGSFQTPNFLYLHRKMRIITSQFKCCISLPTIQFAILFNIRD